MSYLTSFICPLCDRKFFFKATLRLHLERRHTCQICRFTYTDPVELQIHKKSHREGLGQVERPTDFSCILCDRSFENETEVKEHEEQFRCDFCDFTHCKSSEAKKHTKLHGQEDEDFDYHFESVKFEENEAEDDPDEQPLAKRSWKSKKGKKSKKVRTVKTDPVVPHPFPCSFCGELFHDAADHNRHEFECKAAQSNRIKVEPKDPDAALPGEAPSPEPTDTLDLDFDSLSQSSTKSRSGKEYRCPKCNKKFRTKGGCQRHVGRCSEERAPPPDIDLSSLCRINDDGEAEYTCPHCSKVFRTKGGTERHVIQCDGPDRLLYFCPNCDQGFKTRKKLTDHEDHCDGPRETRPLTIDQPSPDERIDLEGEKNKEEEEDDPGRNYIKVKKKKLYTCSGCQKTFKNQQYFLRHEDLCLDSGKHHQCRFCDKVFGTDEKLEIHIKTHTCEHCGKQFKNTGQLFTHKKTHDPNAKKFICDICGCEKTAQAHLDKHRNVHFNRRFNCTECDASFKVEENYKEHVHGHSGKPWPYQCTLCDKGFLIKHKLKRHIEKHEAEGKEDNVCNFCGKTFPVLKKYEYRNHLRSHTDPDYKAPEETPVQCSHCGIIKKNKRDLSTHIKHVHDEKPLRCEHCPKRFSARKNLEQHNRVHTGEKPYACEFCGKRFGQKLGYDTHRRTHTGEKPYKCEYCDMAFAALPSKYVHVKRRHLRKEEFACHICNKGFVTKAERRIHLKKNHGTREDATKQFHSGENISLATTFVQ